MTAKKFIVVLYLILECLDLLQLFFKYNHGRSLLIDSCKNQSKSYAYCYEKLSNLSPRRFYRTV